ncbi:hypothetical protein [Novosphingobium sp. P6W]|uniref:hypothetical protein n=1 Tax=Novosphingobium sp. P6W TaxID=1609758 RepID=UPI0005C3125B|nr:hypothetical protein [Novosphingobium sp. P6W]AXB77703.1 hypothetical protein TQ38_015320 [Novosphingobium sp. P6W]KIS30302.1 hypothetical protein TQ38_23275 [Novosphingobium sp. P6W]
MITLTLAFAGLALTAPAPARSMQYLQAAERAPAQALAKGGAKAGPRTAPQATGAQDETAVTRSEDAARVADWVAASGDNHALPYIIIDKKAASLLLFDGKGTPVGQVPVLLGVALGDEASPGIGSKNLSEIGPAEKTTPAGRFLAKFGVAAGKQRVLWVDYATSVALHPIPKPGKPKERRRERMLSPSSEDNRITFGCINVPLAFYGKNISPMFRKKGGYVYVTPDSKPLEEVFPRLRVQAVLQANAS